MPKDIDHVIAQLNFKHYNGTVEPYPNFNPKNDAETLRKAIEEQDTKEQTIVEISAGRSNIQRQKIIEAYQQQYDEDLISDFKSKIGGDFLELILALYTPAREFDARCLNDAMKGLGTKEHILIEILGTRTNHQLIEIKKSYHEIYGRELEKDVASDTSGYFEKMLLTLLNAGRADPHPLDVTKAQKDAKALYNAGENKVGTNEGIFIDILCTRAYAQLRGTFDEYKTIAKKNIIDSIKSEFSGDIQDGLIVLVETACCLPAYFAEKLYSSMKGLGTKDSRLIRLVTTRVELDMVEIKQAFEAMYKTTLKSFIVDDTCGSYRSLLVALIK